VIDTGSNRTIVDRNIVAQVPALPTRAVLVDAHQSRQPMTQHDVALYLPPHKLWLPVLPILAGEMRAYREHGLDGVLGRDVLDGCLLTYNGPEQTFTLSFRGGAGLSQTTIFESTPYGCGNLAFGTQRGIENQRPHKRKRPAARRAVF
jgi:hypothetical protein